jgi:hypothetical protein
VRVTVLSVENQDYLLTDTVLPVGTGKSLRVKVIKGLYPLPSTRGPNLEEVKYEIYHNYTGYIYRHRLS